MLKKVCGFFRQKKNSISNVSSGYPRPGEMWVFSCNKKENPSNSYQNSKHEVYIKEVKKGQVKYSIGNPVSKFFNDQWMEIETFMNLFAFHEVYSEKGLNNES